MPRVTLHQAAVIQHHQQLAPHQQSGNDLVADLFGVDRGSRPVYIGYHRPVAVRQRRPSPVVGFAIGGVLVGLSLIAVIMGALCLAGVFSKQSNYIGMPILGMGLGFFVMGIVLISVTGCNVWTATQLTERQGQSSARNPGPMTADNVTNATNNGHETAPTYFFAQGHYNSPLNYNPSPPPAFVEGPSRVFPAQNS